MRKPILILLTLAFIPILVSAQGYLHADGKNIVNGQGDNFIARSIGTGNWMLQEGYMMKSTDAGINTQWQFREKLIETIGVEKTDSFYNVWLTNHFTRADVDSMKAWGFNSVRPALHYKWFTLPIEEEAVPGENTWLDKGFTMLDSLIKWCSDNEMYVFLDMHGAPGGQGKNADISDYNPSNYSLWESEHNKTKLIALWVKIAERYKDEPFVGGFDLINEINWDFENSGNENGCNCNQNLPIKELFDRIITAIRAVDTNHMVFVSGNCWGNNYNGLSSLASLDDNLAYTFHKYWNYNDQSSVDWIIGMRNSLNVPLWMSESGENSNTWFTNATALFDKNNIGWSWWPVKKSGINNVLHVTTNEDYSDLLSFWKSGSPAMTEEQAFQAVLKWADNHKIENCFIQRDVIDALTRQIDSYEAIPFKNHTLGNEIFFSDYDLGRNNVAYFDTDTANYHVSTGNYVTWNAGWAYRNDGVDIELCQDAADTTNGFNLGWTNDDEWMLYTLNSDSTAAYTLEVRSASNNASGCDFQLEVNGVVVTDLLSLPGTGGWKTWQTTTFEDIIIPSGEIQIKFYLDKGGSNLSYFNFINPKSTDAIDFRLMSAKTSSTGDSILLDLNKEITTLQGEILASDFDISIDGESVTVTGVSISPESAYVLILAHDGTVFSDNDVTVSYSGSSVQHGTQNLSSFSNNPVTLELDAVYYEVPGIIQVEDFVENNGFSFENNGTTSAFANPGDYLTYRVSVIASGYYQINYRVATERSNAQLIFQTGDGSNYSSMDTIQFSSTGGWSTWETQSSGPVYLESGYFFVRLYVLASEHNLDWFELSKVTSLINHSNEPDWQVYPNPVDDFLYIEFVGEQDATLAIYNILGEQIGPVTRIANYEQIHINHLSPGIYFLRLKLDGAVYSKKIIVE